MRNGTLPPDDFGPLLPGPAFGGMVHVTKILFSLGCFQQEVTCPKCSKTCKLRTTTRKKQLKDEQEKEYVDFSIRCQSRKCRTYIPFIDNTIWRKVKDRVLFVFVVNAFLNRNSTQSIVDQTGCKQKTAEKYMRIVKNALFLENEEEKMGMLLGGKGETVQADESCVFKRKYGVGRILEVSRQGWLFGIVEDRQDGRLFIQMIKHKDATTLQQLIKDHVEKESTIFTDCWPSYNGLDKVNEYKHYNVNHSQNFVETKPLQMTPEEEAQAIQNAVREFEICEDDPVDEDVVIEEPTTKVQTQKMNVFGGK